MTSVRRKDYNRGLKAARKVLVRDKNWQSHISVAGGVTGQCYDHAANVLHGLCLKIEEMLKEKNVRHK